MSAEIVSLKPTSAEYQKGQAAARRVSNGQPLQYLEMLRREALVVLHISDNLDHDNGYLDGINNAIVERLRS